MRKDSWQRRWTAYLASIPNDRTRSPAQEDTGRNRAQLHVTLPKATSALITQIRTEKIGLNAFLADRKVPGYLPGCPCGYQRQTAKHIIMHCPEHKGGREELYRNAGTHNYQKMMATTRGARAAARFLQKTGLLEQFRLGLDPDK